QPPAPPAAPGAAKDGGRGGPGAGGRGAAPRVYNSRSKTFTIFDDLILYTAPDSQVVGLDARTGELRWQSKVDNRGNSSGTIMAGDKVVSGGSGCGTRASCYISAHDAHSGKELWKFYTTAATGQPGGDSWADMPDERRVASTWGSPGAYDAVRDIVYYGIANPTPNSRIARHDGNPFAIPTSSPSALYSNSTVALD